MVGMVTIHSQYIRVCRYEKRAINVEKQKYMDIYYIRWDEMAYSRGGILVFVSSIEHM